MKPEPCPFCGDKIAENGFWFAVNDKPPSAHVFCLECDCMGPHRETLEEAVAAWNGRPQPETTSTDAAFAIGEHAFRAGFEAGWSQQTANPRLVLTREQAAEMAWSHYDPPEDIKALTGELSSEPVAWAYELAGWKDMNTGEVGGWEKRVRFVKPNAPADAIRNLRALR